jgi:glutamate-1-semialdehyde aminotransferase/spore coat polysaccharide biosynthesis protein SpsF (cytidylyltransferase family)
MSVTITNSQNIVAIVQARMGSTRLPGKTMMDVAGVPLLERLLRQLVGSKTIDKVVIATSIDDSDDVIEEFASGLGYLVVRGSECDVLSRYVIAADLSAADVIVRLTADCPLHSPDTVDEVVGAFLASGVDYACNTNPYTRPDGQDVEVFKREILNRAEICAEDDPDREHVTPWMRRASDVLRLDVIHSQPYSPSSRWSVDHLDDLEFARSVWSYLDRRGAGPFTFEEIMEATIDSGAVQGKAVINEGFYLSIFKTATVEAAPPLLLDKSFAWLERSEKVIPGGAQTYSKSWRHHIRGVTPIFLDSGKGAIVTDVDGNQYVDLVQGLLPNILGYANNEVDRAAYERACSGHSFSLPHPIEVELAEKLCRLIPCAEMVRYGKNGSDATAGAVRVARAYTGREHVAVCGYHGWQDWFIGTTSRHAGVPEAVRQLAHTFTYDDPDALEALLSSRPGQFAAVIMEPVNFVWPKPGYLEKVKEIAHKHGALLIFDEICSGFHFGLGGAQKIFGVSPDLATFGKAMGNGWPISCIVGRREIMQVFEDAFVSFTFAGDVSAMAAALKVLEILESGDAYARMTAAGTKLMDGARVMAAAAGLEDAFVVKGHPHWCLFSFVDKNGADDPATRALWVQEVTRRGVLILTTFNISAALDEASVKTVLSAFAHGFKRVAEARRQHIQPLAWLDGSIPVPAFRARG